MHKSFRTIVTILFVVLTFTQVAFATEPGNPPKPMEGIESTDPNHGSSWDNEGITVQSNGLILVYGCSIQNNGSNLSLNGSTTANLFADEVRLTLYLQKWQGTKWVDIRSFVYSKKYTRTLTDSDYIYNYERGNYYRTRAVHYVRNGSETETKSSTSSYIYVD